MSVERLLIVPLAIVAVGVGAPTAIDYALLTEMSGRATVRAMERTISPAMNEAARTALLASLENPNDCSTAYPGPNITDLTCSKRINNQAVDESSVNSYGDIEVVMKRAPRPNPITDSYSERVLFAFVQFTLSDHQVINGHASGSLTTSSEEALVAPGGSRYAAAINEPSIGWAASTSGSVSSEGHVTFAHLSQNSNGTYDYDSSEPLSWVTNRGGQSRGELGTAQYALNHLDSNTDGDLAAAFRLFNLPQPKSTTEVA